MGVFMIRIIICTIVVLILSGCAGNCISIDGTYKEWSGGFTWCLDSNQSTAAGRPVLQNETQQSATIINEAEAIAITEKISQITGQAKAASVSNFAEFNKFLREIMEKKNVNSN